jgi:hypothetical protein
MAPYSITITGEAVRGPAMQTEPVFAVTVENGDLFLDR